MMSVVPVVIPGPVAAVRPGDRKAEIASENLSTVAGIGRQGGAFVLHLL
jgi:hypothetical protein